MKKILACFCCKKKTRPLKSAEDLEKKENDKKGKNENGEAVVPIDETCTYIKYEINYNFSF